MGFGARTLLVFIGGVTTLVPATARTEPAQEARREGLSIGSPTDGRLRGAAALESSSVLKLRWPEGARWALPRLTRMLERAAQRVHLRHPGSQLLVGALSRQTGGSLPGHASHQSGRDADIGFYYVDGRGQPVRTRRLMRVDSRGRVVERPSLRFDVTRNWELVNALLTDPEVIVQHVFVADFLRDRLLAEARQRRVSRQVLRRAARALSQPGSGPPHDNHFHVRIACPPRQSACVPVPGMDRLAKGK